MAIEDIVAEYQCDGFPSDKVPPDNERLGETFGLGLDRIGQSDTELGTVAQQLLETRQILWSRNNQYVPDSGEHQRGKGVVDHRLVIDRQQLLRHGLRHRIQPRARTAREN